MVWIVDNKGLPQVVGICSKGRAWRQEWIGAFGHSLNDGTMSGPVNDEENDVSDLNAMNEKVNEAGLAYEPEIPPGLG